VKPQRLLFPIDVQRCPVEAFELVNGFAKKLEATVILLHVVRLNIVAPGSEVYEELGKEAQYYLGRLAAEHVHSIASTIVHVRKGDSAKQILAEAKAERVDLIILPTFGPSFWRRVTGLWKPASDPVLSTLVQEVVREATCGVFLVQARSRFNCEMAWGRPKNERKEMHSAASPITAAAH